MRLNSLIAQLPLTNRSVTLCNNYFQNYFQAPKKHLSWGNRTLTARDYKPICPQLTNYMFDETHNGYAPHAIKTDEDCLFLNVWTPQVCFHSDLNAKNVVQN